MSRARNWHRASGMAVLVCGLMSTVADVKGQSLGDLANREEARRKAITTPARLYTNDPRRERAEPEAAPAASPEIAPVKPPSILHAAVTGAPPAAAVPALSSGRRRDGQEVVHPPEVSRDTTPPAAVHATAVAPVARPAPLLSLSGWSAFEIKKTSAEMAETTRLLELPDTSFLTRAGDVRPPPRHDVLRLTTGLGYLSGADWGGDITGSGKLNGMQTDLSLFVTAGAEGFLPRSGHISMFSPDGKWRGEGGDLYSDLRGLARGARASWNPGGKWNPSVSLYQQGGSGRDAATVLAYRDRYQLLPHVRVGGELTSDGAAFLQTQYGKPGLDLTTFYRVTRAPIAGRDKGLSGAVSLGRGVVASGAVRLSDAVTDSTHWQLASIRLPLPQHASITLERTWWSGSSDDGSTNAVTLQASLGPVRFSQRIQWGHTDYWQRVVPFGFDPRQSQTTASYTPGSWGTVNYQQSTQWSDDGRMQQWDEVSSTFQIGRKTSLALVTAFPDIGDPQRLRARLAHKLSPTLQLEGQYGRLSAFQLTRASESEKSRVMVTVRKTWQVESPSRGGEVRGRTLDQAGNPVHGALVRLGPYSAITDAAGDYGFTRVPHGDFELGLDRSKLPVAYVWDGKPLALNVSGSSREKIDLQVVPLNAIRGRVYVDGNHNARFDEGEGIPGAVVTVDGAATATTATGAFAFYNQPPGRYTVRLLVPRLAKGLAPVSPAELAVELTADRPLTGVDFTVEKRDMPIIMKEIPR